MRPSDISTSSSHFPFTKGAGRGSNITGSVSGLMFPLGTPALAMERRENGWKRRWEEAHPKDGITDHVECQRRNTPR